MALPPLLTAAQYEARAGRSDRPLAGAEADQFEAFAEDASALVRAVAEQDFLDEQDPPQLDVPAGVLPVVFRVVDRAMENRLGLSSSTTGNFTWSGSSSGSGVYLDADDEDDIRDAIGRARFQAVPLVGPWGGGL